MLGAAHTQSFVISARVFNNGITNIFMSICETMTIKELKENLQRSSISILMKRNSDSSLWCIDGRSTIMSGMVVYNLPSYNSCIIITIIVVFVGSFVGSSSLLYIFYFNNIK